MKVDLSFECTYGIELMNFSDSTEKYYYPSGNLNGGKDGLLIKVMPDTRNNWVGVFAFGEITSNSITGIYSTPHKDKFCVVSKGTGYLVSSINPEIWDIIECVPVLEVYPIKSENILIFADFTELIGYNENGIKWRSERLAYDSFKVIDISGQYLKCEFWNIRNEANETFEVDVITGLVKGERQRIW